MSTAHTRSTAATDCVNLVDKNYARSVLFSLGKEVTDARSADSNEHFNKLRTRNAKEWHIGLASHSSRQQSFTCAWRPDQQNALRNARAHTRELFREFKKLNDFF